MALQRSVGNAAVVQMLRQAGHSWAQPAQHEHGAGCGHQQDQPAVQRSAVHDVLRSGGQPLDGATRTDMETRLGADFSDVRLHNDGAARASAAEVGARAYTSGNHVVIGDGGADRHTLAHELTHVIQQRQGPVAGTDNGSGLRVSDPSDRFEREAEANAHRALSGQGAAQSAAESVPAQRAVETGTVQRAPDNIQDLWTNAHWDREAGNLPAVNPSPPGRERPLAVILRDVAKQLLTALQAQGPGGKELRVFRTMTPEEADQILEWRGAGKRQGTEEWLQSQQGAPQASAFHAAKNAPGSTVGAMPVKKHLGDWDQAYDYYKRNHDRSYENYKAKDESTRGRFTELPPTRVLEFTLKPGAHELLFHPDNMALAGEVGAPAALRKIFGAQGRTFATGSGNEGSLTGHIGMKLEQHGDFSLSVGSDTEATQLLFQLFVKDVQDVTSRASHNWNNATAEY